MLPRTRKKLITYGSRKRKRKPLLRPTVPTNPTPQVRTTIAPTPTTTSTTTTITTTTSKTSSVPIQKKPKLQQLFLDFGQKSFSRVKCKECGMMYAPGRDEDEAAHRLFHRQSSQPVKLRPRDQDTCCWSGREQRRILQFSLDQRENAHRTASLRRRMEEQLTTRTAVDEHECDRDDEDEEGSGGGGGGREGGGGDISDMTLYAFLRGHNVIGSLMVKAMLPPASHRLELSQLWVEPKHRRQGVASRLVDMALSSTVYGEPLKLSQCEMPARSGDGDSFWERYSNVKKK